MSTDTAILSTRRPSRKSFAIDDASLMRDVIVTATFGCKWDGRLDKQLAPTGVDGGAVVGAALWGERALRRAIAV
jgi:hypothetical protein